MWLPGTALMSNLFLMITYLVTSVSIATPFSGLGALELLNVSLAVGCTCCGRLIEVWQVPASINVNEVFSYINEPII